MPGLVCCKVPALQFHTAGSYLDLQSLEKITWDWRCLIRYKQEETLQQKKSASLILPKRRKFWNKIALNSFSGLFSTLGDKDLCWCKTFPDLSEDVTFSSYKEHLIILPLLNNKT